MGGVVSNVGTWMQRTGQDWIVFTELTDHSATAVGLLMAFQFGPQLLVLPFSGYAADHFDLRKLVFITQASMALLALLLGILTVTGAVQLWHVYLLAFLLGCAAAFDVPARQTFISEMVPAEHLTNAIALNSTSFQLARVVGPALAGLMIHYVGTGWVFLFNGVSYCAILASVLLLNDAALQRRDRSLIPPGGMVQGLKYVSTQPDIRMALVLFMVVGIFALNFPIFISTMGVREFGVDASRFGMLATMMAVGSVIGALMAANREQPRMRHLQNSAMFLGLGLGVAALMPNYLVFGIVLVPVGVAVQTFMTSANGAIQLWTNPSMRGRVISIVFALSIGTTPVGALLMGRVADAFGPRWGMGLASACTLIATGLCLLWMRRRHR